MSDAKILIVEDEAVIASEIRNRLRSLGYDVVDWVMSGEEAVVCARDHSPDLVLMDVRLSGTLDGIEAARLIRRAHGTPVVFLTAYGDEETLARAKVIDPLGYILKPFSERELRTTIEVALYKNRLDVLLREREQWLATTLSSIGDAVIATDTDGGVSYLNPVAEQLTGWTADDAAGQQLDAVLTIEAAGDGHRIDVPLRRIIHESEPVDVAEDAVLVRRDGRRVPISDTGAPMRIAPIQDGTGRASGTVTVFRDISPKKSSEKEIRALNEDLKRANEGLEQQRSYLRLLFDTVPCPTMVVGPDRRIRMVNRQFRNTFEVGDDDSLEGPVGQILGCVNGAEDHTLCGTLEECTACGANRPFLNALEGHTSERVRCSFMRKNGDRISRMTFLNSAAPLEYGGERLAVLILEDVTELSELRRLLGSEKSFAGIIGTSPKMVEIFETIREIADLSVPVMILGESGTGKELVARAIHSQGSRSTGSFVPVNCGALPDGLLESELFGHVKGAFTGAIRDRKGRFELAHGGTIFLDEIGDLSQTMQVKLLRVLQEGTFERVGGERTVTTDARVICATNRDLEQDVNDGRFRDDLYYRLCVMPITVPPLRERLDDIPVLADFLVEKEGASGGGRRVTLSSAVVSRFMAHDWPGNVRELQNAITYAFIKCKSTEIRLEHLPPSLAERSTPHDSGPGNRSGLTLAAVADALVATGGNKVRTAEELGVSRATLYRFLSKHPHLHGAG